MKKIWITEVIIILLMVTLIAQIPLRLIYAKEIIEFEEKLFSLFGVSRELGLIITLPPIVIGAYLFFRRKKSLQKQKIDRYDLDYRK